MKRSFGRVTLGLVAVVLGAVLAGCPSPLDGGGGNDSGGGNSDQGAIVLRFSDVRALTIDPDRSLDIDSYIVSFAQDGVPPVTISGIPGTATQTEPVYLDPGIWTVTVTALNDTGDIIGVGSAPDVVVSAGETSSVNLSIASLTGDGTLNLTADISQLSMTAPTVTGSLLPGSGGPAIPISLDIAGNSGSFSGPIPAGSYFLQLELRDGMNLLASYVDSVLIAQDLPSSGSLVFRSKVGSVEVELIDDITRPIAITFDGAQETITTTESMTVTATPSQTVDSFRWFLDGEELPGETTSTVTVGPGLAVGEYELTVLVQKGAIFSSDSVVFEVTEAAGGQVATGDEPIVFISNMDGGSTEVYTVLADGSELTRLTNDSYGDTCPVWSPDRSRIAYVTSETGVSIAVMDADGSNRQILAIANWYERPAWSPDGSMIAFNKREGTDLRVAVVNADGSGERYVTSLRSSRPTWSPDSSRIAFESASSGNYEIYVVNADGSGEVNVTNDFTDDRYPIWSPVADEILYSRADGGLNYVNIVSLSNGYPKSYVIDGYNPSWSPDGSHVAFVSSDIGLGTGLYTATSGGSNRTRINPEQSFSSTSGGDEPQWSPNGYWITYDLRSDPVSTDIDLFIASADGSSGAVVVVDSPESEGAPDW